LLLASSDPSLTTLLPRLFLSMAVVIAVMWFAARLLKGRQLPGSGGNKFGLGTPQKRTQLQVLARQGVGRHAAVTIVRAGDKALVLGITDQSVSLLAELDEIDLAQDAQVQEILEPHGTGASTAATLLAAGPARTGLLAQIRERTVRRA
jgi:flagellar protein FliO/FliZ